MKDVVIASASPLAENAHAERGIDVLIGGNRCSSASRSGTGE